MLPRLPSLARTLRAFSARPAPPRRRSEYCVFRLPKIFVLKVKCPGYPGCGIPGTATRPSFI
jgi:hypothetical protein